MNLQSRVVNLEREKNLLQRKITDLSFLFSVSSTLNNTYDFSSLIQAILNMAMDKSGSEAGSLFVVKNGGLQLLFAQGEDAQEINKYITSSSYFMKKFLLRPKLIKLGCTEREFLYWKKLVPDLQSALLVPLQIKQRLLGLLVLMHLHKGGENHQASYSEDDEKIISVLAQQAALIWENTQLKIENETKNLYLETIQALISAVDAKDVYTRGHSQRVANISLSLGKQLALTQDELNILSYGAILHDIGKIGIKEEILNKPARLTREEFAVIQAHPEIGAEILEPIRFLQEAIGIVRHHHERYDGKGYPDNLKGEEIPFTARIVALADAWDAMTSQRAYRQAMSWQDACKEIINGTDSQFDPYIVKAFLQSYQ